MNARRRHVNRAPVKTSTGGLTAVAVATALWFGAPSTAGAAMAVLDQSNLTQAIEAVSTANKTLAEVQRQTDLLGRLSRSLGTGGLGVLSDVIGLNDSGLGDLLDEARGMCFAVDNLLNTNLPNKLGEIPLPDFRSGCAGFNWAGDVFFTSPPGLSGTDAVAELRRRRVVFRDANVQQGITSGLSHRERVKDTADTISEMRAAVEVVQAAKDSDEASLRHAVTVLSLINLHQLEELAAIREILADLLLVQSGGLMASQSIRTGAVGVGDGSSVEPGTRSGGGVSETGTGPESSTFVPAWQSPLGGG